MQVAVDGNYDLSLIQQCRLKLQAETLSDVCDARGLRVERWAFTESGRRSNIRWANQGEPSKAAWREWKRLLRSLLSSYGRTAGRHLERTYRLGQWYNTHQRWD